ncbi:hypothetical protein PCANC_05243 [Puccinia coronata f. sp. avenae]|uniref:Uncharacterized protein n=1 Tax=Puccinia coronata f. sp. avenae TaxID=200324 RepID=A0A2N5VWA1_9BASI|nr:hypothetical protein PCASD_13459 [Puccinia coronata f. sp. avenae]PLW54269.1 hypothetical protein PCANC_05243 [Puccinia coronata f. sp. avenae]
MPPRKAKAQNKPRPPPTPVPLLSPKIWMANDFEPESVSIPRMRAILDFNQITDSYYRRFQQTALFKEKVVPKVKILVERHGGDISSIEDSVLLKEIQMIPSTVSRKRRASSESDQPALTGDIPLPTHPVDQSARPKTNHKKFKSSK